MHVTPETMEAAYRLLLTTLPFRRWNLPHPDRICFRVLVTRERFGHWIAYTGSPYVGEIAVSTKVKTAALLVEVIAHEMVHMRQDDLGLRDHHGAGFKRLAALVCRRHGWDLEKF